MILRYMSVALSSLCLASSSYAVSKEIDKDGPVCSSMLCAFSAHGGFYAGVTGLYAKPSETGLGQVTDSWQFAVPGGIDARSFPANPQSKWAWGVQAGFDIPMTANNVEVNYLQLNNTTPAVNTFANGAFSFGSVLFPDGTINAADFPSLASVARLIYKVDQIDLKAGRKYTDVSGKFYIRPSLGVRYAQLKHELPFVQPGNAMSKYNGTGPMFSVDANYLLGYGFGLVGYFDYALLAGTIKSNSFVFLGQNFIYTWPSTDRIVHNTTARIGLNYSHTLTNSSTFNIEGGYQVNEYLNSMDTTRGWIAFGGTPHIAGHETNSFAFHGPYATLTVHA